MMVYFKWHIYASLGLRELIAWNNYRQVSNIRRTLVGN